MTDTPPRRRVLTAELLSIGTEITCGETRDTNASELAHDLTDAGVEVVRIEAVPDDLVAIRDAFTLALERADLVVSTGGLGPTPDDLTREGIAAVAQEEPTVDPELDTWLRGLWARRGIAFPEMNRKQAWLIPSGSAIANPNGTAPGWWVDRPDGRVIVALPGPPREMRPMWRDAVVPRLRERGLGQAMVVRTFRLSGIGESQVAHELGEALLAARNPQVATYARAEAVDVRISAVGDGTRSAEQIADEAEAAVLAIVGRHVWARGATTWAEAIGDALGNLGWRLASVELGTGGTFVALLGSAPWLASATVLPAAETADVAGEADATRDGAPRAGGAEVGIAVSTRASGADTGVTIGVATPDGTRTERHVAFQGGEQGRLRAALLAASVLLGQLRAAIERRAPVGAEPAGPPTTSDPDDAVEVAR